MLKVIVINIILNYITILKKIGELGQTKSNYKTCKVKDCNNKHYAKGYCQKYYKQICRNGEIKPANKPKCKAKSCNKEAEFKGYCRKHYQQYKRHGILTPESEREKRSEVCKIDGCNNSVKAKGLCAKHYERERRLKNNKNL